MLPWKTIKFIRNVGIVILIPAMLVGYSLGVAIGFTIWIVAQSMSFNKMEDIISSKYPDTPPPSDDSEAS